MAIYAASYFGICVSTNFSGEVPPKIAENSSKLDTKIGSKAGPLKVSPTIPNVVTPTLCATNDKSRSEVYTPGETKTLFDVAIICLFFYKLFYLIHKYY